MHNACMATKKISLKLEAYEKLRRARRYASESFSEVILRAVWPEQTLTGAELLALCRRHGPFFSEGELGRTAEAKRRDKPLEDKRRAR